MGITGPCGPCTEIHVDYLGTSNRSEFVNKGLHDLTEIWNIVFIEYNRQMDGTVSTLPKKHVDTGMGFERLTSVLQGKVSNYDTDNFTYLLNAIHKNSSGVPKYEGKFGENDWNELDTSYRILADHTRMITACLADGIIPEQNQKLRRILRKAFLLSENVFNNDRGLLKELTNYVVEHLGPVYPEMERNIAQIHQIVTYEEEVYKSIRQTAVKDWAKLTKDNQKLLEIDVIENPNFIGAYREITTTNPKEIDSKLAFKLYDTFGLDDESITKISKVLNLKFDPEGLNRELERIKFRSKGGNICSKNELYSTLIEEGISKTDDKFKYSYFKNENKYIFNDLEVKVLKIFQDEIAVSEIDSDYYCSLLLNKTNLYSEAGGQIADKGTINFGKDLFEITGLENINGYILHKGFYISRTNKLQTNAVGILKVNEDFRLNCMRNHTSTHLLNAALKKIKGATCQKASKVTDRFLNFEVAIFGAKLDIDEIRKIENQILGIIQNGQPVIINEIDSQKLFSYDFVTLIPGEIYPDSGIRIVEIEDNGFISR
ncbi:hypothetical protein NQ314_013055 [Rhamnusium bicolor]|uniref:alanine--tRNA ligase n=1 Tax=Rhamnusium bicolor TaxID=1586634 RepID=A0AAV8X909_9CUCU|nr:hypothetical protein NQ314_013055 [Rhamnusium bicolor]